MSTTRFDVYAQLDYSYDDDGKMDYAHAYVDYCVSNSGDWVRAEDALLLEGRITFLEAEVARLSDKVSDVSQQAYEAGLMDGANQ